ncbi:FIST N-terminal domain-containing protein [Telmatospirillum siberiense]|uniref:histidine kinase n=1 Tax=Telmatospirillum siberiense TaxID=382514 RepID=A0A2N3PT50_9PROT|nr:FIST N-terminal domain-containing protein [Telmatospirillum siberiense]PKU23574.1 histidine kinase [Telmatospirillum siberiense]
MTIDPQAGPGFPLPVRILETDDGLAGIGADDFLFAGRPSPLAVAFISPYLDFPAVTARLRHLGGATPVLAMSTAGELCSSGLPGPLYKPAGTDWTSVVIQIFSPDLLASASIHTVCLHNDDIRQGSPTLSRDDRVKRIVRSLASVSPSFRLDARDSLALTFVDGLSACENYLMEAIYRSARFPCLFVGGSAGGKLDFKHTYLFDGRQVLENHAVLAFVKLAPGKRYGVLKSQNFRKTGTSFVVVDADPDRRTVATVLNPISGEVIPFIDALAVVLAVPPASIMENLKGHTFGIDLDGELFVRSVARMDLETGFTTFFCDVNPGDELHLLQATDFAEQTRLDIETFLRGKPPPLAALLNDCILRRLNNESALADLSGLWKIPVAGFSTFGELFGININQTLTAVVFFEDGDEIFKNDFVDSFPTHYASFSNYFIRCHLNRIEILNRLRSEMTRRLAVHFGASAILARGIEGMMTESTNVRRTLDSIRTTIASELATEERARQAERQLADAIETINERFALYDKDDRLVICNSQYRDIFEGSGEIIKPGRTFAEIARAVGEHGLYGYEGEALETFLAERIAHHHRADGAGHLHQIAAGQWTVSREYRMRDGGIVATHTDVTELKRREQEIEALKQRYKLILDSAGDGIIGIDTAEAVTFANSAACRMLGVTPQLLDGLNYRRVLGGMSAAEDPSHEPLDGEAGETREATFTRADGSAFVAEYVLAPIHEEDSAAGAVLVFRDISLRKYYENSLVDYQKELESQVVERTRKLSAEIDKRARIERALRDSQGRLLAITGSLFEGVLLVDDNGVIVFANSSAHRWLGIRHLAERELDEVLRLQIAGAEINFIDSPFRQVIENGKTVIDDDAVFVTESGGRLTVAYATSPLNEGDRRRMAIVSFRSIDALKEAQREAFQASRLASVGQLAAGIAHEINTPIQYVGDNLQFVRKSLGGLAEVITKLKTLLDETHHADEATRFFGDKDIDYLLTELPQSITESLDGIDHVAHIVRSMREFAHPGTATKVAANINRAISSTITVSRNEWKQVATMETDLDPDLPAVACFPSDINQVLLNLIVNAAHAIGSITPARLGVIRISTRLDGDFIEIRVADSGPGVPAALRHKIFDPFFTTKAVGKGTGQGLAICRNMVVNKHGGEIYVEETDAAGATFVVRLPVEPDVD